MKKSIRMLGLTPQVRKRLEEQHFYSVQDLLERKVEELGLEKEDETQLHFMLDEYRLNKIKEEVKGVRVEKSYSFLDDDYALENFPLTYRSYNALQNNEIKMISQLFDVVATFEVAVLEGFGSKSVVQAMDIIDQIVKEQEIQEGIFAKAHPCDSLPISVIGYSNLITQGLHSFHIFTFGDVRRKYLSGELFEFFNRKTLTSILDGYKMRIYDSPLNDFAFLENMLVKEWYGKVSIEQLVSLFDGEVNIDALKERIQNAKNLAIDGQLIRIRTMKEQIQRMRIKKESKNIMNDRFGGDTLQVVANKFRKTRERIRQIVRDRCSQIEVSYEHAFIEDFIKFHWRPEVFQILYNLEPYSFNVTKYLSDRPTFEGDYEYPQEYVDSLKRNPMFGPIDEVRLEEELSKTAEPTMIIDGMEYPLMTKRMFLQFVIEHFVPKIGVHKLKILDIANEVAERNDLPYRYDKFIDIVSNTIQGLQSVRYYDYEKLTEENFKDLKKILYEVDSVYSMRYFFQKYPKMMESMDIRSGYELHFVLRRFYAEDSTFTSIIDFNRQPILSKKGMLISEVITKHWKELNEPTNVDRFAEKLAKQYGYHMGTLVNNINATLGDYISVKVLYLHKPVLKDELLPKIQEVLTDEFYELEELEDLLDENGISKNEYQYFTNFWLDQFGYKTHDINYVIRKGYGSLKEVFFAKVLSHDIYEITKKDRNMRETTLILFLETLREEFLAFPSKDGKIITMKYLEKKGVKVEHLQEYVEELTKIIKKHEYFTYFSLKKKGYEKLHPIFKTMEEYNLQEEIMNDLIRNVPGIKKSTKGDLFCITEGLTVVRDFVEQIASLYRVRNPQELKKIMFENYGISFKKSDFEKLL